MHINFRLILDSLPFLLGGAQLAFTVTFFAVLLGIFIGLFVALGRLSTLRPISLISTAYVEFIRGTPLLVQIYIIYFALPSFGIYLPALLAGVLALGINSGAYTGEIFRAGIQSIEKGQHEAAFSVGMTYWQSMRYIILPQAFRRIIPPLGNELVTMIKDSSLVSIITVRELMYRASLISARTLNYVTMYVATACIYFAMTFLLSRTLTALERRLRVSD